MVSTKVTIYDTYVSIMVNKKIPFEQELLIQTLRIFLKKRKLTYRNLAGALQVSEQTIKRIFAGKTQLPVKQLILICETLGISLLELVSMANMGSEENYTLTPTQESYLIQHPGLWGIIQRIQRGETFSVIAKYWGLSTRELFLAMRRLEKIGLVELLPGNVARIAVKGTVRWSRDGQLSKTLIPQGNAEFFNFIYKNLHQSSIGFQTAQIKMSQATFRDMMKELQEIGTRYLSKAQREAKFLDVKHLKSVHWVVAIGAFETDWRKYPI